ncbi:MAG: hypothetical protein GY856_17040 [bacterium]|nr:hypothetical protein [bacterium]
MEIARLCTRLTLLPLSMLVVATEVVAQSIKGMYDISEKSLDAIMDWSCSSCDDDKESEEKTDDETDDETTTS